MYPINAQQLMRRGTLGAHALDPTLPHRPPRRLRVQRALAAIRRDTNGGHTRASRSQKPASAGGC
jgi:hypothetical protein